MIDPHPDAAPNPAPFAPDQPGPARCNEAQLAAPPMVKL